MGLRFCNEAIISLHQIWPRTSTTDDTTKDSLTPLQDALIKRLGTGAHPFTLSLSPQSPPSVQLVPAKRYYGAPIGTSYDVRCFIADKTDEKFHRRATVKMGVRVIHRTDIFTSTGPENFAALVNNPSSPPIQQQDINNIQQKSSSSNICGSGGGGGGDSIASSTIRTTTVSIPPYRHHGIVGGGYDCTGGPQGAVDKPFLLQEGRVGLRASLNKSWYTHGEDVIVTVNIKNDSKKTVRRMRICAIQHVDVCMFNNGKFKNIVADSDNSNNNSSTDQTSVGPGKSLSSTIVLTPKRGPTKNWIALEDSLQRSSEPNEITGSIAASAIRIPPPNPIGTSPSTSGPSEDRNVFAIYVSYYVKVKLTLSGMGGELSLKLPFSLVHIESPTIIPTCEQSQLTNTITKNNDLELSDSINKITLIESNQSTKQNEQKDDTITICKLDGNNVKSSNNCINKIDSIEDEIQITITSCTTPGTSGEQVEVQGDIETTNNSCNNNNNNNNRRKLIRSITVDKDLSDDDDDNEIGICDDIHDDNGKDNNDIEKINTAMATIDIDENIIKKCDNDDDSQNDGSKNLNEISQIHQQTICAQVHTNSTNL